MKLDSSPILRTGLVLQCARILLCALILARTVWLAGGCVAQAQSPAPSPAETLPDAPVADPLSHAVHGCPSGTAATTSCNQEQLQQTKRILGVIPNFRAVSSSEVLPPQSAKEKFLTATNDSFDYSSIFIPAALAGYSMARDAYPEFGDGVDGYGKYFWHSAVDQTVENYMVEFVFPVLLREDNRYYTLGHGGFLKRTGYALSRTVVTRTDSARSRFNFSEVIGAGASAGLSNAYYPARERSFSNTASAWGLNVLIDGGSFFVKEFWPDINHHWQHRVARTSQVH